jgi:hypothetical protein
MMRAEGIANPIAALATVLARLILARSNATSGISLTLTAAANSANRTARKSCLLITQDTPVTGLHIKADRLSDPLLPFAKCGVTRYIEMWPRRADK